MEFKSIGKSLQRTDGPEKVTGKAKYIADIKMPHMVFAKILRSPHSHAEILSIETDDAEKMPGVCKVITGKDSQFHYGFCIKDRIPLAGNKVRYDGEPVGAVIAESEYIAEEGLKKIRVKYSPLPSVTDPLDAAYQKAPLIHEDQYNYSRIPGFFPVKGTNIFHHYKLRKGNIQKGFELADIIVEEEFFYPLLSHVQLEPHGCICYWEDPYKLKIWSSTQAPFAIREIAAQIFNIPYKNIKVISPYVGGGFGGKSEVVIEATCAYIARAFPGRPVRFIMSREEVFKGTFLGRGMRGRIKAGARKDGTLTALKVSMYFAGGASGDNSCNIVTTAGYVATGPYEYPHCEVDSYGVYTNSPPAGPYRGYGHPEPHFMSERIMKILSDKLDIKPLDLMRKNYLSEGRVNALGQVMKKSYGNLPECLDELEKALYKEKKPENDEEFFYGRGVASFMKSAMICYNTPSCAAIKVDEDGIFNIGITGVEMGQGCLTVLKQIASETLKVPVDKIKMYKHINTMSSPGEWKGVSSLNITFRVGKAIIGAGEKFIKEILKRGSEYFSIPVEDLVYDGEWLISKSNSLLKIKFIDLITPEAVPLEFSDSYFLEGQFPDHKTGRGDCAGEWTFACQGAEVRISRKTGEVKVTHLATAIDLGKTLHPAGARGQIVGAMMMAYGSALSEEVIFDDNGKIKNPTLYRYKVPRLSDMPEKISVKFIETPDEEGPFGARSIGEHPTIGVAPAILNAISDATGFEFYKLPVRSEDILEKFRKKDNK